MLSRRKMLALGSAAAAYPLIRPRRSIARAVILDPLDFGAVPGAQPLATLQNNTLAFRAMVAAATHEGQAVEVEAERQGAAFVLSKPPGDTLPYAFRDSLGLRWHFGGGGYQTPALAIDNSWAPGDSVLHIEPDPAKQVFTMKSLLVENFSCSTYDTADNVVTQGWAWNTTDAWNLCNPDYVRVNLPNGTSMTNCKFDGGWTAYSKGYGLNIQSDDAGGSAHHCLITGWDSDAGFRFRNMGDSNVISFMTGWGMEFSNQSGASQNIIRDYQCASKTRPAFVCLKASKLTLERFNVEQQGWLGTPKSAVFDMSMPEAPGPMGHCIMNSISVANISGTNIGSAIVLGNMDAVTLHSPSVYGVQFLAYGINVINTVKRLLIDDYATWGTMPNPSYVEPATQVIGSLIPHDNSR